MKLLLALLAGIAASAPEPKPAKKDTKAPASADAPAKPGDPLSVADVIEKVEAVDAKLKTLSADFKQFVRWDESGTAQAVEGSVSFKKKKLLRVEHKIPEPQLIVSDGAWIWVHRKETNQVIQMRLEDWRRSEPMAQGLLDLGGYAELLKKYSVSIASRTAFSIDLKLEPREGKKDFTLMLKISTVDWFPWETVLRVGEVVVRSQFENVKFNPELPEKLFSFTPPPGADVFQR